MMIISSQYEKTIATQKIFKVKNQLIFPFVDTLFYKYSKWLLFSLEIDMFQIFISYFKVYIYS